MNITNARLKSYAFLKDMYGDAYYPKPLVDKGRRILERLCERIELQRPQSEEALYLLTHAATEEFNLLAGEFEESGSEIETAARDCIGVDFAFVASAYGFEADTEALIATRDW